eukprot:TRINITY_DN2292_c0_g1_i2.p1 TRINITY_DN2292_c0_g1~~TRINITY_DN2292_c0_g1_i2.p1  ORF type:complete len:423 (-),score=53.39 TRINITY_DN2292_c0_g1_i2:46-1314(-)
MLTYTDFCPWTVSFCRSRVSRAPLFNPRYLFSSMSLPSVTDKNRGHVKPVHPPVRMLLGPGPSNIPPRVNLKLASPMIGYMDPVYFEVMEGVQQLMRYLFQTDNEFTIPVSGAGSAAMECCLSNLIEPGDTVLVCVSGYFSQRICDMAVRYGAALKTLEAPWGQAFSLAQIEEALATHKPSLLCLVHGETSTGVRQPMDGIGQLAKKYNSLLMVDTVASLGGVPFFVDAWGVDACYTGGQKCLSGPPGISPLTFSPLAMQKIKGRKTPVANWYLDATLLAPYWCPPAGQPRKYHHTTPANLIYSLHEALSIIAEDGLDKTWARHKEATDALYEGLTSLGLGLVVSDPAIRLTSLTSITAPEGVNTAEVQKYLLTKHDIEVAGGLGQFAGKIWRVGLMGWNARVPNVKILLSALKEAIEAQKK